MAADLVPLEVVCSLKSLATGLTCEGWGQVHGAVPDEELLAGEGLVADGARHWVLVHLNVVVVQLVHGGKGLGTGAAGERDEREGHQGVVGHVLPVHHNVPQLLLLLLPPLLVLLLHHNVPQLLLLPHLLFRLLLLLLSPLGQCQDIQLKVSGHLDKQHKVEIGIMMVDYKI